MSLYTLLKYVHVVLAIVAIGFNITYGIWLAIVRREPEKTSFVLRGIKVLDDRFATPSYVLLLLTGIALVFIGGLSFQTFWIAGGLALYALMLVFAILVYAPVYKRQIALAEAGQIDTDEYRQVAGRVLTFGWVIIVIVLLIEFLMVTKPTL